MSDLTVRNALRRDVLVLTGDQVGHLLAGREAEVVAAVRRAYLAHARGETSVPHSVFLRFPGDPVNRIIALPAYLGDGMGRAGVKWVASFPGNVARGADRASAVMVLNSANTGRPEAILEASLISAQRTAASAALAAQVLRHGDPGPAVGLVGCGVINFEIARFLLAVLGRPERLLLHDLDPERAAAFAGRCRRAFEDLEVEAAGSLGELLAACPLVSFATTAAAPHVVDISASPPGSTLLHISLRDLAPEVILACDNVVDDPDHVCRARTSLHLAEELVGHRSFIRSTLGEVLSGLAAARTDVQAITVFSPFGLGILDLAVASLVVDAAREAGLGTVVESFLPRSAMAG